MTTFAYQEVVQFLGEHVWIGTPHPVVPGRAFYSKGILEHVGKENVKLKDKDGIHIIPINQICEIKKRVGV